ncbi:MAG: dihydroorotase [Eubacteriales bacterium]
MIINNVNIIDTHKNIQGNVYIKNGIIQEINVQKIPEGMLVIDGKGHALMPSFVDLHCHLRDPGYTYKEDMTSGMGAALKGGYTHLVAMANTMPIIDNPAWIKKNIQKSRDLDLCDLTQVCAVTKKFGKEMVDFTEISALTTVFSNDGSTIVDKKIMEKALRLSKELDVYVATHCDPEVEIIERDLSLIDRIDGHLHVCHISQEGSVALIKKAKDKGRHVTCEVTPHHLYAHDTRYKVNPPFGTKSDQEALIQAIKDGIIDICATDHAPHTQGDKRQGAPGINNIEMAFGMYWKIFHEYNIPIQKLSEMMSLTPSHMLKLNSGEIIPGKEANLVLMDLDHIANIDINTFVSKSNNNPFHHEMVRGKVLMTLKRGVIKYDHGCII